MSENVPAFSLHQAFITRHEMVAGVSLHARTIALALDHHLSTDLTNLNYKWLFEEVKRMEELVIAANNATMAEVQMKTVTNVGAEVKLECVLTVTKPDGTVE